MINQKRWTRSATLLVLSGVGALGAGCSEASPEASEQYVATTEALTEYRPNQTAANSFYAYDNIVTVKIEMSDADWLALKTEAPTIKDCKAAAIDTTTGESPSNFTWRSTSRVTVSGSKYLTTAQAYTGVQIKKKSYCGSGTTDPNGKPSLKLKFSSSAARDALGLQYIDLNNSQQDSSFVRQTLGYYLFGLAGLPHSRANYAKVQVVTPTKTENFVHINVEPIRASFIENPDNGFTNRTINQSGSNDATAQGNLYELSYPVDLTPANLNYIGTEKVSAIQGPSRPDLTYAINQLATNPTVDGLSKVINVDQFVKFWAMEVLLKHADGFTQDHNNTYIYNDSVATSGTQSDATVDFKFIPWGIDQILIPVPFNISNGTAPAQILRGTSTYNTKFTATVRSLVNTVFSRAKMEGDIKTRLDTLQSQLLSLGIDASADINVVRQQLRLARGAAIKLGGLETSSAYLMEPTSGDVIRASTLELVPNTSYYEIYHRQPLYDAAERWIVGVNRYATTLTSEAYGRNLYASPTLLTPAGNPYIFPVPPGASPLNEAWDLVQNGDQYYFDGTFVLENFYTGGYAHFSAVADTTPLGRLRVYQGPATSLIYY